MAKLVWGVTTQASYQTGVSRGVIYPVGGPAVVWNGLISVDETLQGISTESLYFDGIKYTDSVDNHDYEGHLTAFTTPLEMFLMTGGAQVREGVYLMNQPRAPFGLCYRTESSNGYKIHVVYNVTAIPTKIAHSTQSDSPAPEIPEWKLVAIPVVVPNKKAAAHFIIDSRFTNSTKLATLESTLYGTTVANPVLPDINGLIAILN